jgi:hypothetical protein
MATLSEIQARPIPRDLQGLFSMLQSQSGIMMRNSLALRGFRVPQAASVADIARYIIAHVADGDLSEADGREIAFNCREYSNKRAYLYTIDPAVLAAWSVPAMARDRVVTDFGQATITSAQSERIQYVLQGHGHIRILLTETHKHYAEDLATLRMIQHDVLKYIIVDANLQSGAVTLFMDAPGRKHVHSTAVGYKNHYETRAQELLGGTLVPLSLEAALTRLENEQLLDIPHARVAINGGLFALTARGGPDIRGLPEYAGLKSSRVLHDEAEYVWRPLPAENSGGLTIPVRPLKTFIHARAGEVRFALHSLPVETEYVLSHLRRSA